MTIAISASIDSTLPLPYTTYPYIYGIIRTDDQISFDVAGIDNADEVSTINAARLAAVISTIGTSDFQGMSRQIVLQRLAAHQQVLEAVTHDYPVLPVKFGTILPDESSLQRLLVQGSTLFKHALEHFADKRQIELVVLWNLQSVLAEIGSEPEIVALKTQLSNRPTAPTPDEQRMFGMAIHASIERRRVALREQIIGMLDGCACDLVQNPTMDESMVLNVALLIDEANRTVFDDRLEQIDQALAGLQIRCVGPLPPYSFATVTIQTPSFDVIDQARRRLDLDQRATNSEIKHAYRAQAALVHPDHNAQETAEAHMAELTAAYKLLNRYAASQAQAQPGDQQIWFDRDTIEQTFLIAISRQDAAQEPLV